jgi:tetratricopeptide (TPR) repeat protein
MANKLKEPGQLLFAEWNIDLNKVPIEQLDHYIAVENYLKDDEELLPEATNLEKVIDYLEAFHHLYEVEAWERAREILSISLDTPINAELHGQLYIWGYYREQIELYSSLLGKLSPTLDIMFLRGLGVAYRLLAVYKQAIDYSQQSLALARKLGDQAGEGAALGNLGNAYLFLGDYHQAIEYHQQDLAIACKLGDQAREGIALGNLGIAYYYLGDYSKAIDYYKAQLAFTPSIDRLHEGTALGNLGIAYDSLEEYDQAIEYYQQHLVIARLIGDRAGEGRTLCNWGLTLFKIERYSEALKYSQTALKIVSEIGDRSVEANTFYLLAKLHQKLGHRDLAVEYCNQALAIATELGIPLAKECQELKEKLLSENT